ncbi:unnamed protein product [Adineta ricciae]|uniref:PRA1 family protein n=1 Tax=Adineta ricciae TaxID=249248 RepID=A0A815GY24_ADIRI|nr:unnamed protein product [Adineta ricciae]
MEPMFAQLSKTITSNTDQIPNEIERYAAMTRDERRKYGWNRLEAVLYSTTDLIAKSRDLFVQLRKTSNQSDEAHSLILKLESTYFNVLHQFQVVQKTALDSIADKLSSLHLSEQDALSTLSNGRMKYEHNQTSFISRQDVTSSIGQKRTTTMYRNETTQVSSTNRPDPTRSQRTRWNGARFATFRSFNDFLLDATWNVPNFTDTTRLQNRIISNLLYYQTNYIIFLTVCLFLTIITYFVDFIICLSLILSLLIRSKNTFTKVVPFVLIFIIYYKLSLVSVLIMLLFGLMLPLLVIICHTILRKRNLSNKISNHLDRSRLQQTPMAIFLKMLSFEGLDE